MKNLSNWRSVRLWETALERDLHQRHSLRTHGLLIGSFTLLLMWGVSALQMHLLHVDSLALRYFCKQLLVNLLEFGYWRGGGTRNCRVGLRSIGLFSFQPCICC